MLIGMRRMESAVRRAPQPDGNQRGGCHPDAELVAVLKKADGAITDVALRADPLEGLISIKQRINARAGEELDEANRNVCQAAYGQMLLPPDAAIACR